MDWVSESTRKSQRGRNEQGAICPYLVNWSMDHVNQGEDVIWNYEGKRLFKVHGLRGAHGCRRSGLASR